MYRSFAAFLSGCLPLTHPTSARSGRCHDTVGGSSSSGQLILNQIGPMRRLQCSSRRGWTSSTSQTGEGNRFLAGSAPKQVHFPLRSVTRHAISRISQQGQFAPELQRQLTSPFGDGVWRGHGSGGLARTCFHSRRAGSGHTPTLGGICYWGTLGGPGASPRYGGRHVLRERERPSLRRRALDGPRVGRCSRPVVFPSVNKHEHGQAVAPVVANQTSNCKCPTISM